jgi:Phytanoyl-CoA dioxygenase (PhyH)
MNSIYVDPKLGDDARRKALYDGQLFVYSPTPSSLALCELAHSLSVEAFAPMTPRNAQHEMPVEKYAAILEMLKPKFIHDPRAKQLIPSLLKELGCDTKKTYFDVPRLRTSTSDNYLTSGIAYAFHPHRDTWYSAPQCQINWWLPVYEITPENGMAFHLRYWDKALKNSSRGYNYYRWNAEGRQSAAKQIGKDTRQQPKPEEPVELDPQVRLVVPPGGIIVFSGAHLHSSVPNTSGYTRFSIDFRTVHLDDVREHGGAPNLDSECTGTTMRDYLNCEDLARVPDELIAKYDTEPPTDGVLVYEPKMKA